LGLLTGSTGGADRQAIYAGLADGSLQVVVGTHALIQEMVAFKELALVVIDEQHRFGVEQRGALRQKGYNPHLLVMTATPIPRSLELSIWGHLDVSLLDEMPPGRQPIHTRVLFPRERERAYAFIRRQVQQGRQAFIIYPLVESSDKIEAKAAVDEYERLKEAVFPDLRLGLLHGRMRSVDKEQIMAQFARGELEILVATSVVEVGIDVPNATVMLIEGADRFGLAQLHQFRGRVGRGEHQSYCLLLADSATVDANERLKAVEATTDGFVLAEKDLEMRGPGEFLGTQQSGFPELPMATLADMRLLHEVREVAGRLLQADPDLSRPEYQALARQVAEFWRSEGDLS
jgi:ATP-dependent DNA helicase RecG